MKNLMNKKALLDERNCQLQKDEQVLLVELLTLLVEIEKKSKGYK